MKKLLTLSLVVAVALMATAIEGNSFERMDVNPPPNLSLQEISINNSAVIPVQFIHQAIGATDVAIVIDNSLTVPEMPATRFKNTPNEPSMDIWIFYYRLSHPPLAASVTITTKTEEYTIPRTGIEVCPPRSRSFTSAC